MSTDAPRAASAPERTSPEASAPNGSGRLLTAVELAAKLGVTPRWVYAETRAGRIPFVPLGPRYRRYREEAIDAWLAGLERGAPGLSPGGLPHE